MTLLSYIFDPNIYTNQHSEIKATHACCDAREKYNLINENSHSFRNMKEERTVSLHPMSCSLHHNVYSLLHNEYETINSKLFSEKENNSKLQKYILKIQQLKVDFHRVEFCAIAENALKRFFAHAH